MEEETGYVLFNSSGKVLTHAKFWQSPDMTEGWIWDNDEIKEILTESPSWKIIPAYKKAARLQNGATVIFGTREEL